MKSTVRLRSDWLCLGVLVLVLFTGIQELSATMLVVGNCKPGGYPTIQQAIDAAPLGAKVQVCPGAYSEQITITKALTLQAITFNGNDHVVINPPSASLVVNAISAFGQKVAAAVLVQNSGGPVNVSGIDINSDFIHNTTYVAGLFYQNSPGTISGVTAREQFGNGLGVGIWIEGGSAKPAVTVQNSYVFNADHAGIFVETENQSEPVVFARITNNSIFAPDTPTDAGILVASGANVTVSGNTVTSNFCAYGIWIGPGTLGTVSGNSIGLAVIGIEAQADGVSVASNQLVSIENGTGIDVQTAAGVVKGNTIGGYSLGIEFNCKANPNVSSNTINLPFTGLDKVPSGVGTSTNKIFSALSTRTGC